MAIPEIDIEQYRGQRGLLEREHGDHGLFALHRAFGGNSHAAAEHLGYRGHTSVARRWAKLGSECLGRDKPRRGFNALTQRDPQTVLAQMLARSRAEEYALEYDWHAPASTEVVPLLPLADVHIQSPQCAVDKLVEFCDWMRANPLARWFGADDLFDTGTSQSVTQVSRQECTLGEAIEVLTELFEPIAGQCIGIGDGNHEARLGKLLDIDLTPAQILADRLRVPHLGYAQHMVLKIRKQRYTLYYHHGCGASRTTGAKVNTGESLADNTTAAIVVIGHLHHEHATKRFRREVDMETRIIGNRKQFIAMCPSFLQYGGYGEEAGYRPSPLGVLTLHLGVKEHDVHTRI